MKYMTWKYEKDLEATPNRVFTLVGNGKTFLATPSFTGVLKAMSYLKARGISSAIKTNRVYPIVKKYFEKESTDG